MSVQLWTRAGGTRLPPAVATSARLVAFSILVACSSDGTAPTPTPTDGIINVRFTTTGADVDANGYFVTVDGGSRPTRVDANSTASFRVRAGRYRILVADVAPNCTVGRVADYVTVEAGGEVSHDISGACTALGSIRATVVTTGTDLDADGYRVVISGVTFFDYGLGAVATNGTVTVPGLARGLHAVTLQALSANCSGDGLGPREVDVVSGGTVSLDFTVACTAATWIAYSAGTPLLNTDIYIVRSNGTETRRLTTDPRADDEPAWSPDGTQIAFTSDRDGPRSIYVMNEDGSGVTRLTTQATNDYRPTWSPDGTRIAFVSERDGNAEIYLMRRDGSNQARITTDPARDVDPAWSPDGARIAFVSDRIGSARVFVMNADGSGATRATNGGDAEQRPAWSRDGTRIAYTRKQCGGFYFLNCYPAIYVVTAGGESVEVGVGEDPAWFADGRRIAVTRYECEFSYYSTDNCDIAGIGIVSYGAQYANSSVQTWEPGLTKGIHRNPSWRQ